VDDEALVLGCMVTVGSLFNNAIMDKAWSGAVACTLMSNHADIWPCGFGYLVKFSNSAMVVP